MTNCSTTLRRFVRLGLSLVFSLIWVTNNDGQTNTPAPLPSRVAYWQGVSDYLLPNGLHILLIPDSSVSTITVNVTYLVGSRHETEGRRGWAHLIEHMLGHSTPRHPRIDWELGAHGANWNAITAQDSTIYFGTFAASEENLDWSLDLEADRMAHANLKPEDLASEKAIMREELNLPERQAARRFYGPVMSAAYPVHSYAFPAEGLLSDIEQSSVESLRAFYRHFYRPDNAVLIISGNFAEATALRLSQKYFGTMECPTQMLPQSTEVHPATPAQPLGKAPFPVVSYYVPARLHEDSAALDIAVRCLTQYADSPLQLALVKTRKADEVFNRKTEFKEPGLVSFGAVTEDKDFTRARRALIKTLENNPPRPGDAQIERAKAALLAEAEKKLSSSAELGEALSEWAAMGNWRCFFSYRDNLSKVTTQDVARVIKYYFQAANRAPGLPAVHKTRQSGLITKPDTRLLENELQQYNSDAPSMPLPGPSFSAAPEAIAKNLVTETHGGLSLAFLAKPTYRQTVNAYLQFSFANGKSLTLQQISAFKILFAMLKNGDTATSPAADWQNRVNHLRSEIKITNRNNELQIALRTNQNDLPQALQLAAEKVNFPAFTLEDFEQAKKSAISDVQQQLNDPAYFSQYELVNYLDYGILDNLAHEPLLQRTEDVLEKMTLEQVKQFYRDFYRSARIYGAIVGEVSQPTIVAQLTALFPGPARQTKPPTEPVHPKRQAYPPLHHYFKLTANTESAAFLIAGQTLDLSDSDPDYPALLAGNYLLGDRDFLQSRLVGRLREKMGLTYNASTVVTTQPASRHGRFVFKITCAPENTMRAEQVLQEELKRIFNESFTQEEISLAKSGYLQVRRLKQYSDESLAQDMAFHLSIGRSYQWDARLEQQINKLTPEMVQTALRRHLRPQEFTVITADNLP